MKTERISTAPVQKDPVHERLGIKATARDVRCPDCGVTYATSRRWDMQCPDCGQRWTDQSSRTLVDQVRDSLPTSLGALFFGGCIVFAAFSVIAIASATVGRFGAADSLPFALFLIGFAGAISLASLLRNRGRNPDTRKSPWRPESGFEVSLKDNLAPVGLHGTSSTSRSNPVKPDPQDEIDTSETSETRKTRS